MITIFFDGIYCLLLTLTGYVAPCHSGAPGRQKEDIIHRLPCRGNTAIYHRLKITLLLVFDIHSNASTAHEDLEGVFSNDVSSPMGQAIDVKDIGMITK